MDKNNKKKKKKKERKKHKKIKKEKKKKKESVAQIYSPGTLQSWSEIACGSTPAILGGVREKRGKKGPAAKKGVYRDELTRNQGKGRRVIGSSHPPASLSGPQGHP